MFREIYDKLFVKSETVKKRSASTREGRRRRSSVKSSGGGGGGRRSPSASSRRSERRKQRKVNEAVNEDQARPATVVVDEATQDHRHRRASSLPSHKKKAAPTTKLTTQSGHQLSKQKVSTWLFNNGPGGELRPSNRLTPAIASASSNYRPVDGRVPHGYPTATFHLNEPSSPHKVTRSGPPTRPTYPNMVQSSTDWVKTAARLPNNSRVMTKELIPRQSHLPTRLPAASVASLPSMQTLAKHRATGLPPMGEERIGWEYHNITLSRVPVYGFGIAVSGGRDNPHFMNGDPSIAISDVLKAGPAEGRLMVNDRVISANGISLENVDYNQAIQVLRECGSTVNLLIKRRALIVQPMGNTEPNNNFIKVSLTRPSKKDDFGIVLGCKIYVKEITNRALFNDKDVSIQEGDIIHKINNTSTDGLTLKEARKLLESCKEKTSLVVSRDCSAALSNIVNNRFLSENGNYINGHPRNNGSMPGMLNQSHNRWPSNGFENGTVTAATTATGKDNDNAIYNNNSAIQMNHQNSQSLAAMANGRINNGWSNQNLYVQPPTRGEAPHSTSSSSGQIFNGDNDVSPAGTSRNRGPISEISLSQLDQPATPLLTAHSRAVSELSETPKSTPLKSSLVSQNNSPESAKEVSKNDRELELFTKQKQLKPNDIRYISFQKEGSVGIRLTGGNEVGIFVTAVQPGSPASTQGLMVGDKILKANSNDMKGFTREEAVLYLLRIQDKIELVVQNCKEEYEDIIANQKGDSFYIRVHFNYDSEGKGELSFHVGDIFHVVDTLFNGVVGSWFVYRLGRNNQEIQKGSIPNKKRADELATEQNMENRSKKSLSGTDLNTTEGSSRRGNFFKRRRSARRSKSLSKEHWEDVVFGDSNSKYSAYERVTCKHPGFTRPVVFFGPLADIAREKLLRDYPDKYASPQAHSENEENIPKSSKLSNSGIVRLSSIKEVIDKGKHALLDITPSAVDRLNYAQFYPIVIFMRAENKSVVKELRSRSSSKSTVHRSSRKLFEQSIKLEKLWHHIFTSSITLTSGGDLWYKKLREIIEKQQTQTIWMSDSKPEESISDDFLFPMISRLSYASSPESDLDISANDSRLDDEDEEKEKFNQVSAVGNRLVKSSSDPSLAPELDAATTSNIVPNSNKMDSFAKDNCTFDSFGFRTKDNDQKPAISAESSGGKKPNKQLPLHILLRKELSKALNYDSKEKDTKQTTTVEHKKVPTATANRGNDNNSNYPTLRAGEQYPQDGYSARQADSPLPPPPPPSTLPPCSNQKIQQQFLETPPRIDRNNKPSRFRSAHERLFGSSGKSNKSVPQPPPPPPPTNNVPPVVVENGNYQLDDSDYINTSAPIQFKEFNQAKITANNLTNGGQQRYVTGAFGDTSSYSSDSYNKYGSSNSTLEAKHGAGSRSDPYKFTRSTVQPLPSHSTLSSKNSSLERSKPLPPPPPHKEPTTVLTSSFVKAPPSPPPKPAYKYGGNQSLQYQMNSMSLNDSRPPPPPKPAYSAGNLNDKQNDYDNMPSLYSTKRSSSFHNPVDVSNGPPGYYQSLPQSSFASYPPKENIARYSTTAETISNFMNGTNSYNGEQTAAPNYSSVRKERNYLDINSETLSYMYNPSSKVTSMASPSKLNYDNVRYNPINSNNYMNSSSYHNNGLYLNVPFSSNSYNEVNNNTYSNNNDHSPLPPPPPLPSYGQLNGGNIVQPTPQQPQLGQNYLDLSLNRENRGSAFEVYRKPGMESMLSSMLNESAMFQGLPPPPPPLSVNDFNLLNYTNIDELNSSSLYTHNDGIASASVAKVEPNNAKVIASARGVFGAEGGSLVSAETGVSIIIPPGAIPDGITQEIYFKVCHDQSLVPPLDREKGETLLSPIVMCGPHGLCFNVPVELRLPHCAIVNPESWSFALKSSEASNGEVAGWKNVSLSNQNDGITGNNFNEQFVSVLVDHF